MSGGVLFIPYRIARAIKDDEGGEKIELTDKGIEAYSRFVAWVKEMMQGLPL
ncbi:MAG: hypothetical protein QXO47_10580 [Thermoproteota archaeon]